MVEVVVGDSKQDVEATGQWTSVPRSGEARENNDESYEEVRCGGSGGDRKKTNGG